VHVFNAQRAALPCFQANGITGLDVLLFTIQLPFAQRVNVVTIAFYTGGNGRSPPPQQENKNGYTRTNNKCTFHQFLLFRIGCI
jgi:hypothetical protein